LWLRGHARDIADIPSRAVAVEEHSAGSASSSNFRPGLRDPSPDRRWRHVSTAPAWYSGL
jgi:hypothetical protein